SGSVTGKVWVRNDTDVPRHCALAGSVRDGDQVLVQERYELDLAAGEEGAVEVGLAAATVAPWSHEYPNLYTVALELQSEGAEAQRVWYRTGFRRFELRDQRATLNGNPVRFPDRLRWKKGQTELVFEVHNGYNSIDLSECTLRTMFGMEMMQAWRDVPMECPPGQSATVRIPLWSAAAQQSLENDKPIACRCALLDPTGYRPITADILLIPEGIEEASEPRSNSP
ncbi:MAG: hypothetical protein QGI33_05450, partial [Candidatus Brocadiia bacterium]|nr:hypothetical protein [Candidatus Brocadiia bacterium]